MRHAIDTAPRDGKVIILEDDVTDTHDVAHWSPFGEWVGENGEPSKITPTHWYPMPRDEYLLQEDKESSNPSQVGRARWRFAASSITAALVAAALVGMYFRTEVAAYVTRSAGLLNLQLRTEAAKTAQLLGQEREKTTALVQEATAARQELTEERARGASVANELAEARREVETQVALLREAGDEAVDVKQKPAAVEERPGVSLPLPAWANSNAWVKPAQAVKQPDVTPENSKPAIKPVETVQLPREHAMSPDNGYSCQRYRTYDPASGTYRGYDGRRHSCP
jgi:BA14K-like protein